MKKRIKPAKESYDWGQTSEQIRQLGEAATKLGVTFMDTRIACATLGGAKYICDTIYVDTNQQKTALQMWPYVSKGWKLIRIYSFDCHFTRCDFKLKLK